MISDGQLEESTPELTVDPHYFSDLETDSFGSDSSVSDGLPMQLLHASIPEVCIQLRNSNFILLYASILKVSSYRFLCIFVYFSRILCYVVALPILIFFLVIFGQLLFLCV